MGIANGLNREWKKMNNTPFFIDTDELIKPDTVEYEVNNSWQYSWDY